MGRLAVHRPVDRVNGYLSEPAKTRAQHMYQWPIRAMFKSDIRRTRQRRRCFAIFHRGIGEGGETMLEFAIVAPMLILLMLMIIDLGIMLMSQSLLDGAARDAARLVRTGQIASQGNSITVFENK